MGSVSAKAKDDKITVSREEYEEMKETLKILSDPPTAMRILKSIEQAEKGKTISEKEFTQKFDL